MFFKRLYFTWSQGPLKALKSSSDCNLGLNVFDESVDGVGAVGLAVVCQRTGGGRVVSSSVRPFAIAVFNLLKLSSLFPLSFFTASSMRELNDS